MLLDVAALSAFYGDFQALDRIDFTVAPNEIVAIIGANGAGKSTFLRAIVGLCAARGERLAFDGQSIAGLGAHAIARRGIALVPEGRRLFPSLSVEENLLIGARAASGRGSRWDIARIYQLFPALRERRDNPATTLSGGEQQMTAIGRALMGDPKLLLCDELSLGLAPVMVRRIYDAFPEIRSQGTAIVLVEQDVGQAMRAADRLYCFQEGRVSLAGRTAEFTRSQVSDAYFGAH